MMSQILSEIQKLKEKPFFDTGFNMCWLGELIDTGEDIAVCSNPDEREIVELKEPVSLKEFDKVLKDQGFIRHTAGIGVRIYLNDAMDKAIRIEFYNGKVYRVTLAPCKVEK